jgi:hypothetical protein
MAVFLDVIPVDPFHRYDQYDRAIATVYGRGDTAGEGDSRMAAGIVFLISAMTFRNFSVYYWRSMNAKTSGSAPVLPLN